MIEKGECEKPNCAKSGEKSYTGKNGNTLYLCERHYYDMVSGTDSLASKEPIDPFWDSGTRCNSLGGRK